MRVSGLPNRDDLLICLKILLNRLGPMTIMTDPALELKDTSCHLSRMRALRLVKRHNLNILQIISETRFLSVRA